MNKMNWILKFFCVSCLVILLVSCDKRVGKLATAATVTSSACDTVTYTKQIKKIIDDNCVSCHGPSLQQSGVILVTYSDVKTKADQGRIKARVIDGNPSFMPQGTELSPAQKSLILCWLSNGEKQ